MQSALNKTPSVKGTVVAFILLLSWASGQDADVKFDITEELPVNSPVGSVSQVVSLFSDLTDRQKQSLKFDILSQATPPASLFNISHTGGMIYVARRIDREEQCFADANCIFLINILASPQTPSEFDSRVVTVHFRVLDINDNAPTFKSKSVSLEIPERNSVNAVLKISGATDRDFKPEFNVKNYTLSEFHDIFQLTSSETLDGTSEIDLKLLKSLDRETRDTYEFTITAYDGGVPPKSQALSVTVHVTDQNDNDPVFENATYSVTVDRDTPPLTVVVRVSATDADIGANARLTYDFSSVQKPLLDGVFSINSTSGEISVVGPLQSGVTEFIVEAQDSGSPRLKTQTIVTVNVVSTGNVAPMVSITTVGANTEKNSVSVREPGGRNLFVAFVVVSDDEDEPVNCEISSSDVFRMETIPNKGYQIVLQGKVDRETRASYNLTVVCADQGNPPLNASASVTVKVEDANDNTPEFTQKTYQRTIKEGRKNGEYVLQVSATDKDIGMNGAIDYSIDPDYLQYFSINRVSGVLSAVGLLDREAYPALNFKVYATDRGNPQNQGSADVSITIEDVNDNPPQFTKKVFSIRTYEEVEGGPRIVGELTATDPDAGLNGHLEYHFTASLDGADRVFSVLSNGSIQSSERLDREERVNYSFSVMVRDKGNPPLMSSASVVVDIIDINDNSPMILFPRSQNHTVLISSVPETGVVLSRIIAYDDDAGDNGSLKFTIVSGNEDRAFEIDEASGEFRIADGDRLKNHRQYTVGVVVSDRGLPPRHNTTAIRVDVQYSNLTLGFDRADKDRQEDYIIIVAIVAAVTFIFSTVIIVAICVVFHKDRNSRRKTGSGSSTALGGPKHAGFKNLTTPDSLSEDEKALGSTRDKPAANYPLNNLSSPSSNGLIPSAPSDDDDGAFFQVRTLYPDRQQTTSQHTVQQSNIPRGKAVSFSLDSNVKAEPPPALSTFSSPRGDEFYGPRGLTSRQVSGVTYTPVSTASSVHGDDVTSDTSGDTTTSDSGRGNSVDDVNFDQIMKDDLSPKLIPHRHRDDLHLPPRKSRTGEANPARASYHVRFAQHAGKSQSVKPPVLPPKQALQPSGSYDGGRAVSAGTNPTSSSARRFDMSTTRPATASSSNVCSSSSNNGGSNITNKLSTSTSYGGINSSNNNVPGLSRMQKSLSGNLITGRQMSVTSIDDDATTTTSGSYVINPDDVRMEALVGSDIIV
ncbi:protocadherin-11 X-linked [Elysia marginata]|uniref:Protocadherin-11 X-linked n=1 Tax=Elysia marginata TaxID=1093978 RepID=A0AAV4JAI0_9GAST|nr:protocadherin-11 X-linked [Elysia marginata]